MHATQADSTMAYLPCLDLDGNGEFESASRVEEEKEIRSQGIQLGGIKSCSSPK